MNQSIVGNSRASHRAIRKQPLASACAAVLLMMAASASAEEVGSGPASPDIAGPEKKSDAESTLDTIVVTGIRGSIENALQAKQNSDDIIEAISAEDIGKLPDLSIAESLARLPGLATQRIDGHANVISIRGLSPDFAGTTLNGREQATTGENRGVEYDQYPSELISGAAVYKTPDASLIGQGLSGTVDLHTIRPLDFKSMAVAANLRGERTTNGDLNPGSDVGKSGHRISFSFVDQFLDHTLGVAFGLAQLDSPIQEKQYQAWWWSVNNGPAGIDQNWGGPHTPGLADGVITQEGMQLRAKSESQLRDGAMMVVEWAPTDRYHSTVDLYYSKFQQESFKNGLQWSSTPWDGVSYSDVATSAATPYPIVTSGNMIGLAPIMQNEYGKERDYLLSAGWNNRFEFDNHWQATADLSYSSARDKILDAYAFTGLPNAGLMNAGFRLPVDSGYPSFTPSVNLSDPANVVFTDPDGYGYNGRKEFDHQKDEIKAVRVEVSHPLGWIFGGMNLGLDYSDRSKAKQADVFFAWLNGNGSVDGTYHNHFYSPIGSSYLDGLTSLAYGGVPGIVNYDVLQALANQFYLTQRNGKDDWSRNYTVEEKVPLAYARFNIDTALGSIPLRGNVGVQFVHTDQSSTALQSNGDTLVGTLNAGTTYNNVLPSLNLVADLGDQQYLRFGLAKSMARGRIDDEKVASSVSVSKVTEGPGAGQVLWSGSGGNPFLKPYVAVGTDLSWEKYFGDASYVAVAVFNKNLLNYIYTQTTIDYDFSGYTNDNPTLTPTTNIGSFSRPQNGTGGRMRGLELSAALEGKRLLDVLDGFGIQANYSLTNSYIPTSTVSSIPGGPTTLPGLSRKVGNVTVYYEKYGFSLRLAERYRSAFTGEAIALFDQLGYTKVLADRQTDFQAGYGFSEGSLRGLSVLLQVNNVTNSPYRTQQVSGLPNGVSVARPLEFDTYGRTILLGVNYKL